MRPGEERGLVHAAPAVFRLRAKTVVSILSQAVAVRSRADISGVWHGGREDPMTSRVGMVRAGIGWCLLSGVMVGMPIAAARFVTSEGTPRAAYVVGDAVMVDLKELWRLRELNDEHPLIRCSTTPSDPPGMIFPFRATAAPTARIPCCAHPRRPRATNVAEPNGARRGKDGQPRVIAMAAWLT